MPEKNKKIVWDLSPLLSGDSSPLIEKERKILDYEVKKFVRKYKNKEDYLKSPIKLRLALDDYEKWSGKFGTTGNQGYYFWLRSTQDENSPLIKAKLNQVSDLSSRLGSEMDFFYLRISKISPKIQKKFLSHSSLKKYKHFLEKAFLESKYLLSEAEEKILNYKKTTSYSNWVRMVSDFISKEEAEIIGQDGNKKKASFSQISSLINNHKKEVRDSAALALNKIFEKHLDVAEWEINSVLGNKKSSDELRGLSRPDLSRHISDDISSQTVDLMISSVSSRFDISKRYYSLKAKLLGVKKLKYWERNTPYGKIQKKYSWVKAVSLVDKCLSQVDREFSTIFSRFIKNRQIDVFPEKGKTNGAFCAHELICQPTYILLNFSGKINDVLTLAHELGHGINNELMRKIQHSLYFNTPTSTAEVASTFMEDFVLKEILNEADDELKLALIMEELNDAVSSIFRQVACYKFELELHEQYRKKGYLSGFEIGKIFSKHMSSYMGNAVEQSPGSQNWWIHWSHIRNYFYVYSYASGLLISKSLQGELKKNSRFILKIKEFLSAGSSDSPQNIFNKLGINISDPEFWQKGLVELDVLLKEAMSLAKKLGKL